jgi:hypothetical protein
MFLCFAEAEGVYATPLNRFAAFLTGGKFCHVAVVFELPQSDGTVKYVECSIVKCADERLNKVHLSEVEDMSGWTCFRLQLQNPVYELEAYNYVCKNLLGMSYDDIGSATDFTLFWCCPVGTVIRTKNSKIYCSRLAMKILQRAGQFLEYSPGKISPNDLYKLIQKDKTACWTDVSNYATSIFTDNYQIQPAIYVYSSSSNQILLF